MAREFLAASFISEWSGNSSRRFSIGATYSPVENIPIVNTMQAHDRICNHSIEVREAEKKHKPVGYWKF